MRKEFNYKRNYAKYSKRIRKRKTLSQGYNMYLLLLNCESDLEEGNITRSTEQTYHIYSNTSPFEIEI